MHKTDKLTLILFTDSVGCKKIKKTTQAHYCQLFNLPKSIAENTLFINISTL